MAEFLDVVLNDDDARLELHFEDDHGKPVSVPLIRAEGDIQSITSRWRIQHDTVGHL